MKQIQKTVDVFVTEDGKEFFARHLAEAHEISLAEIKEASIQQLRNQETLRDHQTKVDEIKAEWRDHPERLEQFLHQLKEKHNEFMQVGMQSGWWSDVTERGDPVPNAVVVDKAILSPEQTTMAHILAELGWFQSVTEARKNGWNKPIELGEFWFFKKTKCLKVIDTTQK